MLNILMFLALTIVKSAIVDNCMRYVTNPQTQISTCIQCRDGFFIRIGNCIQCNKIIKNAQCSGFKAYSYGSNIVNAYSGASAYVTPAKTTSNTSSTIGNTSLEPVKQNKAVQSATVTAASVPKLVSSNVEQVAQNSGKNVNNNVDIPTANTVALPTVQFSGVVNSVDIKANSITAKDQNGVIAKDNVIVKPNQPAVAIAVKQATASVSNLQNCKQIDTVSSTCVTCFGAYDLKQQTGTNKAICVKKQSLNSGDNKMNKCLVYSQVQNKCIMCQDQWVLAADGICKQAAESMNNKKPVCNETIVPNIAVQSIPIIPKAAVQITPVVAEMNYVKADVVGTLSKTHIQDKALPALDGQISMEPSSKQIVQPINNLTVGNLLSRLNNDTSLSPNVQTLQAKKSLKLQLNSSQSSLSLPAVQNVNNSATVKSNQTLKIQVSIEDANSPGSSYIIKATDFDPCAQHQNKDDPKMCTKCTIGFILNSLQNKCVNVSKSIVLSPKRVSTDIKPDKTIKDMSVNAVSTPTQNMLTSSVPLLQNSAILPTSSHAVPSISTSTSTQSSTTNSVTPAINSNTYTNVQPVGSLSTTITITVNNNNPNNTIINISTNSSKPTQIDTSGFGLGVPVTATTNAADTVNGVKSVSSNIINSSGGLANGSSSTQTASLVTNALPSVSSATLASPVSAQATSISAVAQQASLLNNNNISPNNNINSISAANTNSISIPVATSSTATAATITTSAVSKDLTSSSISSSSSSSSSLTVASTPTLILSSATPTLSLLPAAVVSPSTVSNQFNNTNTNSNSNTNTNMAVIAKTQDQPIPIAASTTQTQAQTQTTVPSVVTAQSQISTQTQKANTQPVSTATPQILTAKIPVSAALTVGNTISNTATNATTVSSGVTTSTTNTVTSPTATSTVNSITSATNNSVNLLKTAAAQSSTPLPNTSTNVNTATTATTVNNTTTVNSNNNSNNTVKPSPKIPKCTRYRDYSYTQCTGCDTGYQLYQNKCYDIFSYRLLMKSKMLTTSTSTTTP